MARPFIEIDMEELATFMRLKPSLEDCAAFFKCSPDTIERRIKEHSDITFAEFREQNMVHTRFNLIRTAINKGLKGDNVMLIFCLKNLCGWKDKQPEEVDKTIINNGASQLSDEQLNQRIEEEINIEVEKRLKEMGARQ
jgi:hypothetical protein